MKTAISVPDGTFERATQRAGDLGVSRSEFFARAADRYLEELDAQSLTARIDEALDGIGALDGAGAGTTHAASPAGQSAAEDSGAAASVAAGRRVLAGMDDEW